MADGSIQKINRPKPWRARYKAPDGRERSRSFARKADAERWLRAEQVNVDRGEWIDPQAGTVTFAEWAERWYGGLYGLKPKTLAGYRQLLDSRVLPTFGPTQLRHITAEAVRRWIAAMVDEGLSPSRIRQAYLVLSAALDQAAVDGRIGRNPAEKVKTPPVRSRRQVFLTETELDRLTDAAEARQVGAGALVFFLGWSGLRWGEAVALRPHAVEVERRRVNVAEAVTEIGGKLEWGTPKTHEERSLILPPFLMDRLAPLVAGRPSDSLIFTAPQGGTLRSSNFRRSVWQPAVAASGVPAELVIHDLRHTAASLMIASGATIKAVQNALGHATASMTLDRYGHLYPDDQEDLAARMQARYEAATAAAGKVVALRS